MRFGWSFGFALILLTLFSPGTRAQARVFPQWTAFFDANLHSEDQPLAMAADALGNVYITGSTCVGMAPCSDQESLTIKYDADGRLIWKAFLKGPQGVAQGTDIGVDGQGNVYVLSTLFLAKDSQHGLIESEFAIAKFSRDGVREWIDFVHNPGFNDFASKIAVSSTGDAYVGGSSTAVTGSANEAVTIKYDTGGRELWRSMLPAPAGTQLSAATAIALDAEGNVLEAIDADSIALPPPHEGAEILKYDPQGNLLATFGGEGLARVWSLKADVSGNSYIAADESTGGSSELNPVITKFDSSGKILWSDHFAVNPSQRHFAGLATDRARNVFVAQTLPNSAFFSVSGTDISVIKLDSNGNQQWTTRYNAQADGSAEDTAVGLAVNFLGEPYVTGASGFRQGLPSNYDFATIKYDTSGKQLWVQRLDGATHGNDLPAAIVIQADGGLVVTGTSDAGSVLSNLNWATIDYIQDGAKLASSTLDFGNETLKTKSASQIVALTNASEMDLIVKNIAVIGDFQLINDCPTPLVAGASCNLEVTFTPTALGLRTGSLSVLDQWEGSEHSPQTVKLRGTGVSP
jgi:WD40 repeat protein